MAPSAPSPRIPATPSTTNATRTPRVCHWSMATNAIVLWEERAKTATRVGSLKI